jgi:type II secretory pathway component PulF
MRPLPTPAASSSARAAPASIPAPVFDDHFYQQKKPPSQLNKAPSAPILNAPDPATTPAVDGVSSKLSVGIRHVVHFSEQLLTLMKAGLSIDRALHTAAGTISNKKLQQVVLEMVVQIEKGDAFSDAIRRYPKVFPRLYVNMVKAGERGGILPTVLERVIDYYTRSIEFRTYVVTASIYPAILLVFGVVSVLGLVTFVVPKFAEVFATMDKPLPVTAALLIDAANGLRAWWLHIVIGIVVLIGGWQLALRSPAVRVAVDRLLLKLPIFGALIAKMQFAQICRTWGTLLGAGVPILTAIRIVQDITPYVPIAQSLGALGLQIKDGLSVSSALNSHPVFPKIMAQLAKVGEESGTLDVMLLRVADQFEKDVQKMTKSFIAAFEPMMILAIGGMIGFVVVSMLLAVFSLNDMPI